METKVIDELTYYQIESPKGVKSEFMDEDELNKCRENGYFVVYNWRKDDTESVYPRRYKVGKICKFVRKTIITEEDMA